MSGTRVHGDQATTAHVRTLLSGRYKVEEEVGRGGMGVVYAARDEHNDLRVAIKVLRPDVASVVGPERFIQEISIAGRLNHPSIVPIVDSGTAGGLLYCVMPFVEGESLRARLKRDGPLSFDTIRVIVKQVAAALDAAHTAGVIHRDVKPENILLTGDTALVTDFGLARALDESGGDRITSSGIVLGTPAYMSPEQAGAGRLDHRTDIYSLAVTVHEMLVGEPPFTGPTIQAVVARHMHERPPSVEVVRPSVPPEFAEALAIGLAKSPPDRFPSAGALARALENRGAGWRLRLYWRRHRTPIGAIVMVLASAGAWAWLRPSPPILEANRVVVFPFEVAERSDEAAGKGWLAALAVEGALEHSEPLRWIDGKSHLGASDANRPAAEVARRISRGRGARYYMDGAIRGSDGNLAVTVRLHDVQADSLLGQETASGPTLEVAALRATIALLPRLVDPTRRVEFAALTDRRPEAIALWIQGEREYRLSQFGRALAFYRRAIESDSALAIAAAKGAQAAAWEERIVEAQQLASLAGRMAGPLPDRMRNLVLGLEAFYLGQAEIAKGRFAEARKLDPASAEAAMGYGEVHRHLLPVTPAPDSVAEAAFEEAAALDTAFTPPLIHLTEYAIRRGDLDQADRLEGRLRRAGADTTGMFSVLRLMAGCVRERWSVERWGEAAKKAGTDPVLAAARQLAVGGYQPQCAAGAYRSLLATAEGGPHRWTALMGLQGLSAAQGLDAQVGALLDSALSISQWALALGVLDGFAELPPNPWTSRSDSIVRSRYGEWYENIPISQLRWLMMVVSLQRGDAARADSLVLRQRVALAAAGSPKDSLLTLAMEAQNRLVRGDTSAAIHALQSLRVTLPRDSLAFGIPDPLPIERILLARLHFARGQYQDAFRTAQVFDHEEPLVFHAFIGSSLRLRRDAALRLGLTGVVRDLEVRLNRLAGS